MSHHLNTLNWGKPSTNLVGDTFNHLNGASVEPNQDIPDHKEKSCIRTRRLINLAETCRKLKVTTLFTCETFEKHAEASLMGMNRMGGIDDMLGLKAVLAEMPVWTLEAKTVRVVRPLLWFTEVGRG